MYLRCDWCGRHTDRSIRAGSHSTVCSEKCRVELERNRAREEAEAEAARRKRERAWRALPLAERRRRNEETRRRRAERKRQGQIRRRERAHQRRMASLGRVLKAGIVIIALLTGFAIAAWEDRTGKRFFDVIQEDGGVMTIAKELFE